jgi:hypothetical protein
MVSKRRQIRLARAVGDQIGALRIRLPKENDRLGDSPIWSASRPLHVADDGLSAFTDANVFNRDLLLSLASVAVERFYCFVFRGPIA